jgi:hypothetical protein
LLLAGALWCTALGAQTPRRVTVDARFYKTPGSTLLGTVVAGAEVWPTRRGNGAVEVGLDGWVFSSSLGPFSRDDFDVVVTKRTPENLRQSANGPVLARLVPGAAFNRVETQGGWTRVRRTVWLAESALAPAADATAGKPGDPERAVMAQRVPLALRPDGPTIGSLDSGTTARTLAHSGGWTRVEVEAWVPDSSVQPATEGVLMGVSAAEVRANPSRYLGQMVQWRVQYVALQRADELRPEMPAGRPYLLTRGPLPETGFVYVMLPENQVSRFEGLPPLRELVIRGLVRAVSTKYLPTPVLELSSVVEGLGS